MIPVLGINWRHGHGKNQTMNGQTESNRARLFLHRTVISRSVRNLASAVELSETRRYFEALAPVKEIAPLEARLRQMVEAFTFCPLLAAWRTR
jgi:hypothetical protein